MEEKKKLDKSSSVGASNRGYEIIGNQGLQEGTLPDLKEVYSLFPLSPPHYSQKNPGLLRRPRNPRHRPPSPQKRLPNGSQPLASLFTSKRKDIQRTNGKILRPDV